MNDQLTPEDIAPICHEANRAYQIVTKDPVVSVPWSMTTLETRRSAIEGVVHAMEGMGPEALHEKWKAFKVAHGWVYGEVKDEALKTHPCIVPYAEIPEEQKVKDSLFLSVVRTFAPPLATIAEELEGRKAPLPVISQTVQYTSRGSADGVYAPMTRAAVVTGLRGHDGEPLNEAVVPTDDSEPMIDACVLNPEGFFFNTHVPYADEPTPGCWNYANWRDFK